MKQRYNDIIADPEVQELIRVRDKAERDYNSAMYQAWKKGQEDEREKAHQEKIESAKKMLADGFSIDLVAKYLELSLEELQKLV